MQAGRLSFLIALGLAVVIIAALLISACRYQSDSCGIMQGLAFYAAPLLLLVLWPLAYGGLVIVRMIRNPSE
jgi:hypothetical protein